MATSASEHTADSKEAETTSLGNRSLHGAPQPVIEAEDTIAGRVFSGTQFRPPGGAAAQLLSSNAMSSSVNSSIRFATVQRAQQTYGNRFVQRLANRLQQTTTPSRIQRHCACGGTCDECRAAASDIQFAGGMASLESPRLVQEQPSNSITTANPTGLPDRLVPLGSGGDPLDRATQHFMESRFYTDFADVRVHTDSAAEQSATAIDADAFTTGRDIYFASGKYAPASAEGRHLLAHELTHVVQQAEGQTPAELTHSNGSNVEIGVPHDPLEREAEQTADRIMSLEPELSETDSQRVGQIQKDKPSRTSRTAVQTKALTGQAPFPAKLPAQRSDVRSTWSLQRQASTPSSGSDSDPSARARATLQALGISLSDEDLTELIKQFPSGDIVLSPVQLTLYGRTGGIAAAAKIRANQVLASTYTPRTATYVVATGAGRSILVVGEGGASRLFDAGNIVGRTATAVNFLVQAGLAKTPGVVKISHTDSDHVTDLQQVVEGSGMPKPLVEITKQQLQDPKLTQFATSRLSAIRPNIIEIDVSGEGVHVHREISGALQYTDFRWAPAHAALATGGMSAKQRAGVLNAGSPVTIIRDLLTGEVRVYTADSEPTTVMKMFQYIHPSAMPYLFGEGQLKEFELPHHGGASTETRRTEAALNYVRMLRLAYEASDGTTTFFTQTQPDRLEAETSHVRALHAAGFPIVTALLGGEPGQPPILAIRGGVPETLNLSAEEQSEVNTKVRPGESALMNARKVGAAVAKIRNALQIQLEAAQTGSPEVAKGISAALEKLEAEDKARSEAVQIWWSALERSLIASGGFNKDLDVSSCREALAKIGTTSIMTPERLAEWEQTVEFMNAMMGASGRVAELALGMADAMLKQDWARMESLKTRQGEAYREAVAAMGGAKVEETVRNTWKTEIAKLQQIQGQLLEMGYEAAKAKAENRLATASMEALADQMKAEAMVTGASEGRAGIPRTSSGDINQMARVGAGALAALEVVRIILDLWHNIQAGMAAAEVRAIKRQLRGWNRMQCWVALGAMPQVEVVDDDNNQLSPRLTDIPTIYKVMANEKVDESYKIPDHPRIVVTGLSKNDQMLAATHLFLNVSNLDQWHQAVNDARGQQDEEGRPQIEVDDTGSQWGVYVWDAKKKDYTQQVDREVSALLNKVYTTCFENSDAELKQKAAKGDRQVATVKLTGWVSKTRDCWIYSQRGGIHKSKFPFEPSLLLPKKLPADGQVMATAADAATYDFLRQFLWPTEQRDYQALGQPVTIHYESNTEGRCYVDVGDLEMLPPPPGWPEPSTDTQKKDASVQRKTASSVTANSTTALEIARAGVASAESTLPYAALIQDSFGHHDIGTTKAQIEGEGTTASEAIAAKAYAHGDRVAFASSPDLHTAAHEAAHVVQQRAGRAPAGGLDTPGDQFEQEANLVADAVVAGGSAEAMLDSIVTPGGASVAPSVQRDSDTPTQRTGATNPDYVNQYRVRILAAVADRIAKVGLSQPHPRLRWWVHDEAAQALGAAIWNYVDAVPDMALKRLMMLSYPADLFALVDAARRGPEGSRLEAVRATVAIAFDEPLTASIRRMGTRLCVQMDLHGGNRPNPSELVASSPLDGLIAEFLVKPGIVSYQRPKKGAPDDIGGRPFARGVRPLQQYEWQGARDPALWNWIRVISPANATAEDVAQTPFAGDEIMGGSEQAYRIASSPPYFGIPFETARLVPEAIEHAPPELQLKLASGPGPRVADPAKLGRSIVSDEAALAQAPVHTNTDPPLGQSIDRVRRQLRFLQDRLTDVQLGFMRKQWALMQKQIESAIKHHEVTAEDLIALHSSMSKQLTEWQAAAPLTGAIGFVNRRTADFERDPKAANCWVPVLAAQERILYAVASELQELLDALTDPEKSPSGATILNPRKPEDAVSIRPVKQLLDAYARAAGVSHLHAEAPAALAEARRQKTMLQVALAEESVRGAQAEVTAQRAAEKGVEALEPNAEKTPEDVIEQMQAAADLRLQAARGEKLDPAAINKLSVDASETALRARLLRLATQAHAVMRKADDVGLSKGPEPGGFWSVHMVSEEILRRINGPSGWHERLDKASEYIGPRYSPSGQKMSGDQTILAQRGDVIANVSKELNTFATELDFEEYLQYSYDRIRDQELRNMIASMALQIGVMIITGEIIGAVGVALRGAALAGEIGAELRAASLLYKGGEIVAHAGLNTVVQGAFGGKVGAREFAENALAIVLTSAVMKPFEGLFKNSAAVEGEIRTWGQLARRSGKAAAELVVDTGAGIGAASVAHAMTHGGELSMAGQDEWITQGISIAASKFVHSRTEGMIQRIQYAKGQAQVARARELEIRSFDDLAAKVESLRERSDTKHLEPKPEEALAQLTERHALLIKERELYKNSKTALAEIDRDLAATGAQFADVPLRLAHLSPVVEGHIYEGTHAQIENALRAAEHVGVPMKGQWFPEENVWRGKSGDRTIEIHQLGSEKHLAPQVEGQPGETLASRAAALDPDTTAKPGDFTPEQIDLANKKLAERINDPKSVREVTDPQLKDRFDLEVELGDGQKYRRKKDGTWCLSRNPTRCGNRVKSQINQAADQQKRTLEPTGTKGTPTDIGVSEVSDELLREIVRDATDRIIISEEIAQAELELDPLNPAMRHPRDYLAYIRRFSLEGAVQPLEFGQRRPVEIAPGLFSYETGPRMGTPTITNQWVGAGSTYRALMRHVERISQRSQLTEREILEGFEELVRFQSLSDPLGRTKALPDLALLMFAREGIRNPASTAHSIMALDLMLSGRLSTAQVFDLEGVPSAAGLPQAIQGANPAIRTLEEIRYRETYLRTGESPLAGTGPTVIGEPIVARMPRTDIGGREGRELQMQYQVREATLFRDWLQLQAKGLAFKDLAQARRVLTDLVVARMKEFYRLKTK
jgi:Zn-dependent peptidase ImmA (M78 family)